jgi:hypothetical protein
MFLGLVFFGPGLGIASAAASSATLSVAEGEAALPSRLNNAAFHIGGAIGTAMVTGAALARTDGPSSRDALTHGLQSAFAAAIAFPALGLVCAMLLFGKLEAGGEPEAAAAHVRRGGRT